MSELERVETGLGEECGVFGAYDMDGGDVAPSVYYGLFALHHFYRIGMDEDTSRFNVSMP